MSEIEFRLGDRLIATVFPGKAGLVCIEEGVTAEDVASVLYRVVAGNKGEHYTVMTRIPLGQEKEET